MGRGRRKRSANEDRLRDHLAERLQLVIGRDRGAISRAAERTGIPKQSLSRYLKKEATPTPETLRILCAKLRLRLDIEGAIISASDFRNRRSRPEKQDQLSLSLSDVISSVDPKHLRVEVLNRKSQSIELKVSIEFSPPRKGPKRSKSRHLSAAS